MGQRLPHVLLILTIVVWGSSFPVMSFLLNSLEPMPLALGRFFIPALLSLVFIISKKNILDKKDIIRFVLAGLTGIFAYNLFLNTGQQTVSAGASSFIVNCNPLFASLIGFYILRQKVKRYFWFGIILCIFGVFIISLETYNKFSFNLGVIYILIAALLTSSYFHIIKPLVNKYGALTAFSFTIFFGTLPMLFWFNDVYQLIFSASSDILIAMSWLSIICTLLGYYTWTYSVGFFGANKASFFLFLIPVFSIIIDFIIFYKLPNVFTLVGGLLILTTVFGIMILSYREK